MAEAGSRLSEALVVVPAASRVDALHVALAKALAGKSPDEQAKILHRLAAKAPLWKELSKAGAERPQRGARGHGRRRSAE